MWKHHTFLPIIFCLDPSAAWRITETNGGSLSSNSNWAAASSKQEAFGQNVSSAQIPAVTFDLGREWDDWGDFDDQNLIQASETSASLCKTEHQCEKYKSGRVRNKILSAFLVSWPQRLVPTHLLWCFSYLWILSNICHHFVIFLQLSHAPDKLILYFYQGSAPHLQSAVHRSNPRGLQELLLWGDARNNAVNK